MTETTETLALKNAPVLRALGHSESNPFDGVVGLAQFLGRDVSNLRKSLKALQAKGLVTPSLLQLTKDGRNMLGRVEALENDPQAPAPIAVGTGGGGERFGPLTWAQITHNPLNPRTVFDDDYIAELAESIADKDLRTPVVILPRQATKGPPAAIGAWLLEDGDCRHRAIGTLIARGDPRWPADKPVPYTVSAVESDTDVIISALITGTQKRTLQWGDQAAAFVDLIDNHGLTTRQIAQALGDGTGEDKLRGVQQYVKVWRTLTAEEQAEARTGELNFTQARHQVQRAEDSVFKLEPKQLLVLAEIADHCARHKSTAPLTSYFYGTRAEVADDIGGEELDALKAANLVTVLHRKGKDGRSFISVESHYSGGNVDYRLRCTIPAWAGKPADRTKALDDLRRAVFSADYCDARLADKKYATPWLNGPFEVPLTLAQARAKAEQKAKDKEAKDKEKAREAAELAAHLTSRAQELKPDRLVTPPMLAILFRDLKHPGPFKVSDWGSEILDASGNFVFRLGYSAMEKALTWAVCVALNTACGLETAVPAAAVIDDPGLDEVNFLSVMVREILESDPERADAGDAAQAALDGYLASRGFSFGDPSDTWTEQDAIDIWHAWGRPADADDEPGSPVTPQAVSTIEAPLNLTEAQQLQILLLDQLAAFDEGSAVRTNSVGPTKNLNSTMCGGVLYSRGLTSKKVKSETTHYWLTDDGRKVADRLTANKRALERAATEAA